MRKIYTILLTLPLLFLCHIGLGQVNNDSLRLLVLNAKNDTTRVLKIAELCQSLSFTNYDSAIMLGKQALTLSEQINYKRGILWAYIGLDNAYLNNGEIAKGLKQAYAGLQLAEGEHFLAEKSYFLQDIGFAHSLIQDYPKSIDFFIRSRELNKRINPEIGIGSIKYLTEVNLASTYILINELDSALAISLRILPEIKTRNWRAVILQTLGDVYIAMGDYQMAKVTLWESLSLDLKNKDMFSEGWARFSLAKVYKEIHQIDSCLFYAKTALLMARATNNYQVFISTSQLLAEQYEGIDIREALRFRKTYDSAYSQYYGSEKILALQKTLLEEQQRETEIEAARAATENRIKQYGYLSASAVFLLIAFILYRNNRQKQKANKVLESTLDNLKTTQSQLVQSEKMASLGELTAGIAHEIQNPLNFVNNFSEVSAELVREMVDEVEKGNSEEVKAIAFDVAQNLEKINHHGKRAADIVKGMLQHSRTSSGQKELTDINGLADEYLRLAYHGLRAKDKTFNAKFETHLDPILPKLHVIPQDIGRVLLNLINNAFYTVSEKQKAESGKNGSGYEPTVTVTTKKLIDKIEISVKDNGNGIPDSIREKIFQPFFTTKPTGQGTGLGLSLSYDIVKAHGGELKVETKDGEGTIFIFQLPT